MKIGGFLAYRQSKYQYTMADLFNGVQFAKFTSTYERAPIEQFAKSAEILNNRWEENKAAKDQIDIALSNIKVEDIDNPVIKARINVVKDQFKDVVNSNAYENAGSVVKNATVGFLTDKAVKAATTNYELRQKTKDELRQRYDKNELSATQYADRIKRFQQYGGIGVPDDLGFYQDYNFDYGVKKYDLAAFAANATAGFKPDTINNESQKANYSSAERQALGIAETITTSGQLIADGSNVGLVIGLALKNNPDALAYIDDEVRIHNENNPNDLMTRERYIDNFTKSYIENESYTSSQSSTQLTRDEDELRRARAKSAKEEGYAGSESLYTENGYEVTSLNNMRSFAEEQLSNIAKPSAGTYTGGGYNTGFIQMRTRQSTLSPKESEQFNNIKAKVAGKDDHEKTINALKYIQNLQNNAKNVQYLKYDVDQQKARTDQMYKNRSSRIYYELGTGKEVSGSTLDDLKPGEMEVLGKSNYDNNFQDLTNNPSYSVGEVVTIKGKKYIMGASVDELSSPSGQIGQAINIFTSSRRLGNTVKLFNDKIDYLPNVPEFGNRSVYKVSTGNGKIHYIDTYITNEYGNVVPATDEQIYSQYYNITHSTK